MDQNKDDKAVAIKRKVSAFSSFLEKGLPFVKENYPDEVDFVLANKDKSFPEIIDMLDTEMASL